MKMKKLQKNIAYIKLNHIQNYLYLFFFCQECYSKGIDADCNAARVIAIMCGIEFRNVFVCILECYIFVFSSH